MSSTAPAAGSGTTPEAGSYLMPANQGILDGSLFRTFQKLTIAAQTAINVKYNNNTPLTVDAIGKMTPEDRANLKKEIQEGETSKSEAAAEAKTAVENQGMEDDELEGDNRLVFIGTGSGGSSDRKNMNDNMTMKNSTYYAATIVGDEAKQVTSVNHNVEVADKGNVEAILTKTKQAIIKTALVKDDTRGRLTNTLSTDLKGLLPTGVNNLKFANKLKQSLQLVIGYNIIDDQLTGKGRIQFVPQVGGPVSSVINITNNEYGFDDKAILANKEAGKSVEAVVKNLTNQEIKPAATVGGKKRKTNRKKSKGRKITLKRKRKPKGRKR